MKIIRFLTSITLSFCLIFTAISVSAEMLTDTSNEALYAGSIATEYFSDDIFEPLDDVKSVVSTASSLEKNIDAKSAILIDVKSGTVLFEKDSHLKLHPASITKIMTLLLVMESIESGKISLDDEVQCSEHAASMGGSQIWLEPNETMSVDDLLKATCVASANDAATALGEYIAGSEDAFVAQMNEKAKDLGMNDTHFENCTGLDAENHMTSAYDISLMSRILIGHDKIKEYSTIWMDSLRDGKTELVNTNRLVRFYEGATGLKTGTTDDAGSCLSATAQRGGLELCAVVMGCKTSNDRFNSARTLLDYGFANYEMSEISPDAKIPKSIPVKFGVEDEVDIILPVAESFLIPKGKSNDVEKKVKLNKTIEANVEEGEILGNISLVLDGKEIGEYPLCAGKSVERMNFKNAFLILLREMTRM
jgi:D-alanyl-D-alanine carboxypeptidase (penicillin-binding protein 5/6)